MPTLLERLATSISRVSHDEIPAPVADEGRRRLLDAIGCMIGGSQSETVQSVYAGVEDRPGSATLVGDDRRSSIGGAALANCAALRYLDYMDGHPGPYPCHPSLVIPAALAAAEACHATGADLIRGIVLGYEVDIRLQLGSGDPDITAHGWSGSTNLGLAIPAAIGGILGLPTETLAHAMAISLVHAPALDVTSRGQMAESKACVDGMVALSAVTATLLARQGVHGKLAAFEGDDGFVNGVARSVDEDLLVGPVERFRILDVYTKRFNAVKCAQSAAGSALRLRDRVGGWEEVESVTLRLAERDWRNQCSDADARRRPGNRDTANHSALYCLAAAFVEGRLQAAQFDQRCLSDSRIMQIIDRTVLEPDSELTGYWPAANPARVEIRTRSGDVFTDTTVYFEGHPKNPMSDRDLEEKFCSMAVPVLGERAAESVVELVRDVRGLKDVSALVSPLVRDRDRSR
jgi:2-methylcitrate dehydratase